VASPNERDLSVSCASSKATYPHHPPCQIRSEVHSPWSGRAFFLTETHLESLFLFQTGHDTRHGQKASQERCYRQMSVHLLLVVLALTFAVASFIPGWPSSVLLAVAVILVCVRLLVS
jgi:hypothetical protein